jgi:hexosaminidase
MEYQVLPRLLAMAERAWSPDPVWSGETSDKRIQDFNADWAMFANKLGKRELPRLDYYNGGYNYRLPSPAYIIDIDSKKIRVNTELPGFQIRYTTDGSEPVSTSEIYTTPVDQKTGVKFRAFNTTGRGGAIVEMK